MSRFGNLGCAQSQEAGNNGQFWGPCVKGDCYSYSHYESEGPWMTNENVHWSSQFPYSTAGNVTASFPGTPPLQSGDCVPPGCWTAEAYSTYVSASFASPSPSVVTVSIHVDPNCQGTPQVATRDWLETLLFQALPEQYED